AIAISDRDAQIQFGLRTSDFGFMQSLLTSAATRAGALDRPTPSGEDFGDFRAHDLFTAVLKNQVHAEVMRISEQSEDLLVVVAHEHELLDEAFGHRF